MIDTQTNQVVGSAIKVGKVPVGIAISPGGATAYVANPGAGTVSVISIQNNQVVGTPIKVGEEPGAIAITPDGATAYVVNNQSGTISVISTQTNQVFGSIKINRGRSESLSPQTANPPTSRKPGPVASR